uniref:diguanylate cyclase n=1 Tax=Magnetococcus massalia (strain MO-1) TaxID=451514 RepID=A0A1S7LI25_MAGMO|nr:Conserved protein of unknown function. Putative response regulator receiver [Candidatus Magnetococcus massalia]
MSPPSARPKILIVDDDPLNVRTMAEMLADEYLVLVASSGEDALQLVAEEELDLILLDVVMPGMDGYSVCQRLKSNPTTEQIPIIFVSAMSDGSDEALGLELGAVDYITKPPRPAIFRARVRNHVHAKRQHDALAQLSNCDGLTGIPNRRHFDEVLKQSWLSSVISLSKLSMILLDIDDFYRFNESYGHEEGDKCLKRVAQCLERTRNRSSDFVARYGGEEFVYILPGTDAQGVALMAEKVRRAVAELAIPHTSSEVADHLTVSLGAVTLVPSLSNHVGQMLTLLNENLQQAKQSGRNRVVSSEILE